MASKKATAKKTPYVPLEERQEFLDMLATAPAAGETAALKRWVADSLALFNDAVRGKSPEQAALAELRYEVAVYRLHGDSFFGCAGVRRALKHEFAAEPGQVPGWSQGGEWLEEVAGMRIRVVAGHGPKNVTDLEFYAVDLDKPFLSKTGFRSHFTFADRWFGMELGAAVRQLLESALVEKDWQLKPIDEGDRSKVTLPAWLAAALAGVTRNGQLAMPLSGEVVAEPKGPMSNAERQRLFRKRQKTRLQAEKAGDFAALEVTDAVLQSVWEGLPSDFSRAATALGLLRLRNNQHAELVRAVQTLKGHLLDAGLDDQAYCAWRWNTTPLGDYRATSAPEYMERQSAGLSLSDQVAELTREVAHLREENKALGESRVYARKMEWEAKKKLDEITAELKELVGAVTSAGCAPGVEAALRAEIEGLRKSNAMEVADRARAFDAVEVLQVRLKKAGLVSDFRRQSGE